jgi:hypothetical protein
MVWFLELLGFDCCKPGVFNGEWIDRIYENTFLLCYERGPECLIVELAESITGS